MELNQFIKELKREFPHGFRVLHVGHVLFRIIAGRMDDLLPSVPIRQVPLPFPHLIQDPVTESDCGDDKS